ncbi:MAG TPA: DUF4286 family protein [Acetobacteraceae bacterium]|nr:DUF4286 family protein [Acetobacteraceae bacterium]
MEAPVLYIVRFWVAPDSHDALIHWLDSRHMAEVVAEPGFRWVRRVKLADKAADDWQGYMMIYGLDSLGALHAYMSGPAPRRFAEERKPFEAHMRMDRCWGEIDKVIG